MGGSGNSRRLVLGWCLVLMSESLLGTCRAQVRAPNAVAVPAQTELAPPNPLASVRSAENRRFSWDDPVPSSGATRSDSNSASATTQDAGSEGAGPDFNDNENALGIRFIKNLASDQTAIWTSPFHLRWDDATWLLPLGEVTAGFLATDPATARAISNDPTKLNRYRTFSNYGLGSLIAAGGGMYVWGRITHDDHKRETGVLAAEAVIDSLAVNSALEYTFQRERPYQDQGSGLFFHGGTSFPSDHAVAAWSAASVIAHEYPSPLVGLLAYGMATAVIASRVMGKEHYPSDVVVGSAIGWLIGREVYRRHHDPDVGGGGWDNLSGNDDGEDRRDPQKMGSPFVPLDSWVYPALDRLAALGYINTAFEGMKPWTRIECAHLIEEAAGRITQEPSAKGDAAALESRLEQEFSFEFGLFEGQRNLTANLDSIYARTVSISGPALTDSYHFGQTVSYDFGRPFERGTNGQIGGSFSAAAGPVTFYVRAEYQHAPSAPAPSAAVINVIAQRDEIPPPPDVPVAAIDRPELLDAYLAVNLDNWEISLGRQSLEWGPGPGGSLLWSDNIQPVNMVRIVNPEPLELPSFLHFLGPVRVDQFFGRLEGHYFDRRPFMMGQKISFKPLPCLEIGYGRTLEIGGGGPNTNPLTAKNLLYGLFGQVRSSLNSVPGHSQSYMDWTFYVPKTRNYVVFYGDVYAADDPIPWENPPKNPFRPGIYITHFPKIAKLDFHVEAANTESPGFSQYGVTNHGDLNYWNHGYQDGSTYNGFLIGNTVGRMGQAYQGWLTYGLSPNNTFQLTYKNNSVDQAFIPGGGAWQDYGLGNELYLRSGFYLKSAVQYEHISHYPILFKGPQQNVSAIVEFGFMPHGAKAK
jgi:membrane-associated phospholipid phosphatase